MSVLPSDIRFYGSANMPENDSGAAGGAVDTSVKVTFEDIDPAGNIQVVSSAAGDTTQTVTVTGRTPAGVQISEAKTLNGTTAVAMTTNTGWERLLKAVKSATTTGDVAVEEVTAERSNTAQGGAAQTASTMAYITLDAGASAVDDAYNGMIVRTTGGTGANQIRTVADYDGATKRAYVSRDWGTVPDNTTTFRLAQGMVFDRAPSEILTVVRPFWGIAADVAGGSAREFYAKVFAKNDHATLALTSATISEAEDPSGLITFALETTLDGAGTSTNRVTAPASGVSAFDSASKNVANSQNHSPGAAQGIWLKLSLAAGAAAQDTYYVPREQGTST